ncbi:MULTISPECIES: hypothetical protein [Lactococcus]|uniref:Uncharacterized protein n=1 Tax=Lactococcus garvieae TaxID=1363 RepID=A0AA46TXN3_9LACT|nr:hypothetical protein [Lactococcus garvieae]UYT11410.1 hypothetical protein OF801_06785 [Lactococcus garvieae]UYT13439.1 hypothetical protein OF800_06250 [Lactococcus garvieae]
MIAFATLILLLNDKNKK